MTNKIELSDLVCSWGMDSARVGIILRRGERQIKGYYKGQSDIISGIIEAMMKAAAELLPDLGDGYDFQFIGGMVLFTWRRDGHFANSWVEIRELWDPRAVAGGLIKKLNEYV